MAYVTDADGVWEVTNGVGCVNRRMITPSAKYLQEHPEWNENRKPTPEERVDQVESAVDFIITNYD